MKLSLEEEIEVLQETKGLPTGQRCMALGYPEIKLPDLEERFAVHKLAAAQNQQETDRVYGELAERFGIHSTEARERFAISADGRVEDMERQRRTLELLQGSWESSDRIAALMRSDEESLWSQLSKQKSLMKRDRLRDQGQRLRDQARLEMEMRAGFDLASSFPAMLGSSGSFAGLTLKKVTGFVKIVDLDEYMEETIPERVLDSIQVAREAGLKTFKVAYPCLKVDQVELRQADPVVFAELGSRWLEVDMWE